MKSSIEGGLVVAKLEDGEDFLAMMGALAKKYRIGSGVILGGIGMMRDCTVGYFPGKGGYEEKVFREPMELVSMQGNIATGKGRPMFHVHVSLAGRDKSVHGGHLIRGTVNIVNEISILRLNRVAMERRPSPRTGLMELDIGTVKK